MRTHNNLICVTPDWEHKQTHVLPDGNKLLIQTQYNENLRERNQQRGYVVYDYPELDLVAGDEVMVQHFTFMDHSGNVQEGVFKQDGRDVTFVIADEVFGKVVDGKLIPLGEYVLGEEIQMKGPETELQLTDLSEPGYEPLKVKVLTTNVTNTLKLKEGDTVVLIDVYCKYFLNHGGKEYVRFREDEVIGFVEN